MEKRKRYGTLFGIAVFFLLFLLQVLSGMAGSFVADRIPFEKIDPYDSFARISIHHAVITAISVIVIVLMRKRLKIDFYIQLGDKEKGKRYLGIFLLAFALISVAVHIFMRIFDRLPVYSFPLDKRNVIGTLGFQLLLSGPAEELLYRALPVSLLTYAFGRSIPITKNMTLEVFLASLLFSFAHTRWSLNPPVFEIDFFNVFYAFILGSIQGTVYQKSKSIVYPVLMHSFSNVFMVGIGYLFSV
jgi:membrane protease YdiL (CAAX protease family)